MLYSLRISIRKNPHKSIYEYTTPLYSVLGKTDRYPHVIRMPWPVGGGVRILFTPLLYSVFGELGQVGRAGKGKRVFTKRAAVGHA